jgi:uncharacterized protein YxjI
LWCQGNKPTESRVISRTTSAESGERRSQVAEVSNRWFRVRDSYGVETSESENEDVMTCVCG